jgi:predicted TIM-barrel fold metal-dependent hydrolase
MDKRNKRIRFERVVEELRKHGVHVELVKPRAQLSVYKQTLQTACPSVHENSSI